MSSSVPFQVVEGQVEYRFSGVGAEHVGSFYEMKNRAYGICPRQMKQPCGAGRAKNWRRMHTVHSARSVQDVVDEPGAKS